MTALGDECVPLKDVVRSRILKEYGERQNPLNILAVTDGATDIRRRLRDIFDFQVTPSQIGITFVKK